MSGGFKRSSWFGIVGVLVVMALVAVIGLPLGSGEEVDPKPVLALIFGILAVLFALQRSDLEGVSGTDKRLSERTRRDVGAGRRSIGLGMVIVTLIFLTVPSIYLLESFVPLMIGGPLIAIAAIYGSVRAVAPGGEMDQGYANVRRATAPLGLEVTERPKVSIERRDAVAGRVGPAPTPVWTWPRSRGTARRPSRGGPEGIVVTRKGGDQADWLCHLWLAERLAVQASG
jgi:hypothetical protein